MTKFELAVQSAFNNTIKHGRVRELKELFELFEKHGGMPKAERDLETREKADAVMVKIATIVERMIPDDQEAEDRCKRNTEERAIVMACPTCRSALHSRWAANARPGLLPSHLQEYETGNAPEP